MDTKSCTTCHVEKPLSAFRMGRKCRECEAAYLKQYAATNKERLAAYKREWHVKHPESNKRATAAYRERNREKEAARAKRVRERQPEVVKSRIQRSHERKPEVRRAASARRKKQVVMASATLLDTDRAQITRCFELAQDYRDLFGFDVCVDHIIPLCGKTVCGLHVPWNLRIVYTSENVKKFRSWAESEALSPTKAFEDRIANE